VDPVAARHVLTPPERDQFEADGFLMLRDVVDAATVARVRAEAAREDARFRSEPGITPHHVLNLHDLIGRAPLWLDLVDWPTTFPKVWGVLGWHIQLFHTQLLVTPPAPPAAAQGAYGWHQDNNRMNLDLETVPQPRISVKVGYFASDLPEPGMGNLFVVPGSHRAGRPPFDGDPPGAIELVAAAGDAILFDRRLWHSASTNTSEVPRVFLTYGYSHRWLRPKSRMALDGLHDGQDPVRRQLLGWSSGANAYFDPTDEDVPLRAWIREHLGDAAVAP
jgi:ectoine hydroxylase-related dioxygenase (phytanoyl-CoA dioxygenase family)